MQDVRREIPAALLPRKVTTLLMCERLQKVRFPSVLRLSRRSAPLKHTLNARLNDHFIGLLYFIASVF